MPKQVWYIQSAKKECMICLKAYRNRLWHELTTGHPPVPRPPVVFKGGG